MRIVKDFAVKNPNFLLPIFNLLPQLGMPRRWRTAVINPLHKNGSKTKVTQYRPISNLDSLSKLYEKMIMERLNQFKDIDGSFQHGFRANRSTTTAMLEIQDFISGSLDSGKIVGSYSLDLSAAFDLLRPEILLHNLREILPNGLTSILMDFLSHRNFSVEVEGIRSRSRDLKVGCVQGSILGPRLFTIYMRKLEQLITSSNYNLTAYADDTYVSIAGKDVNDIKTKLEEMMTRHDDFLQSVGMKTNVSKTELIFFSRKNINAPTITVKNNVITPTKTLKILGIKFDQNLMWDTHLKEVRKKAMLVINKLKFLSKFLTKESMKKVVTSHFFGMIYYSSPVWLTEISSAQHWKILNSLHYRALRSAARDFTFRWSKDDLNTYFKRATPLKWMRYSCCKMAISLYNLGVDGPPLTSKMRAAAYINDRQPLRAYFMDTSRLRIGKHSLPNRVNSMRTIAFDWVGGIDKHKLRIELKKTFVN